MIACLDVDYRATGGAVVACLVFEKWESAAASNVYAAVLDQVAEYESGAFYKRELPCLLAALAKVKEPLDFILVDSYVFLDNQRKAGMGAHLYEALNPKIPVIGIAKTYFVGTDEIAAPVKRGSSQNPLFVSAIGVETAWAATKIQQMHGLNRLPTLLKEVDSLCRTL